MNVKDRNNFKIIFVDFLLYMKCTPKIMSDKKIQTICKYKNVENFLESGIMEHCIKFRE